MQLIFLCFGGDTSVCGHLCIVSYLSDCESELICFSASFTWTRQFSLLCHTGSKCFDFSSKKCHRNVQTSYALRNCPLRDVNESSKSQNCPWRTFSLWLWQVISIDILIECIVRPPLFLHTSEGPRCTCTVGLGIASGLYVCLWIPSLTINEQISGKYKAFLFQELLGETTSAYRIGTRLRTCKTSQLHYLDQCQHLDPSFIIFNIKCHVLFCEGSALPCAL